MYSTIKIFCPESFFSIVQIKIQHSFILMIDIFLDFVKCLLSPHAIGGGFWGRICCEMVPSHQQAYVVDFFSVPNIHC